MSEAQPTTKAPRYWQGPLPPRDDFGRLYGTDPGAIMIDGSTRHGPWANMTESSFAQHGKGVFGPGYAQKYQLQPDGRWLKIEG